MIHVSLPDRRPAYPDRIAVSVPLGLRALVQRAAAAENVSAADLVRRAIERAAAGVLARHRGMERAAAFAASFDPSHEVAAKLRALVSRAPASMVDIAERQMPRQAGPALHAHHVASVLHALRDDAAPAIGALADAITEALAQALPGYAEPVGD